METTIVVLIGVVVVVLVGGIVLFLRRRNTEDDSFYHFRCPKCKRRLRFQARQVGRKGKCSNCAAEVVFPPTSQSVD